MSRLVVLLAALPVGCWVSPTEVTNKIDRIIPVDDTGDTDVPGPLDIELVEPAYGTEAGGTTVTIHAAPLARSAEVTFDGVAAEVTSVTGGTVVVKTPPGSPGLAAIEVVSGAKSGRANGAFRYWEDGTGQYGTIGAIGHYEYEGEYATWIGADTYDFAWVDVIHPAPYGYGGLYGTDLDTCHSEWAYPGAMTSYDTGASVLQITRRTASTFALPWDGTQDDFEADMPAGAFGTFSTYDLEPIEGESPFPSFGVPGLAVTPGPFTVISPNIYSGSPFITISTHLQWTTNNPGDFMVARLLRWSGGEVVEEVRCLMRDDGDFSVPSTVWQDYAGFQYVDIFLGRVLESQATLPLNNARSGVAGVYWVVGSTVTTPAL